MKPFQFIWGPLTLALILMASSHSTANVISGGEIFFEPAPTASMPYRIKVFVNLVRDVSGPQISHDSLSLCIKSSCFANRTIQLPRLRPSGQDISPFDSIGWKSEPIGCADPLDPNYPQYSIHRYTSIVNLSGNCGDFTFSTQVPYTRASSINVNSNNSIYLEASLNSTLGMHPTPKLAGSLVNQTCVKGPNDTASTILQGGAAAQHSFDSVFYRLSPPLKGPNCGPRDTVISYSSGFSYDSPFGNSAAFSFDNRYGKLSFKAGQSGTYTVIIEAERKYFDMNTLLYITVATSLREIQISVTDNCVSSNLPSLSYMPCDSSRLSFNFNGLQVDSIESSYGNISLARSSFGTTKTAYLDSINCGDTIIQLCFADKIQRASIVKSDFKIYGPDTGNYSVEAVIDTSNKVYTNAISLKLDRPVLERGNYLISIEKGGDGNTLIHDCGESIREKSFMLFPSRNCNGPLSLNDQDVSYYAPNFISPNGDGRNDYFFVDFDRKMSKPLHLKVFNQQGQLVYENSNFEAEMQSNGGWNGKSTQGVTLPNGLYIYSIESETIREPRLKLRGRLILQQ